MCPSTTGFLEIETPDALAIEDMDIGALGRAWRTDLEATRSAGDEWLRSGVPPGSGSHRLIVPATWNVLMNPQHPKSAQARIVRVHSYGISIFSSKDEPERR